MGGVGVESEDGPEEGFRGGSGGWGVRMVLSKFSALAYLPQAEFLRW
jgi:hypothetical protein